MNLITITLGTLACTLQAQYRIDSNSLQPLSSERTAAQVFQSARTIRQSIQGIDSGIAILQLYNKRTLGREWEALWYDQFQVNLSARTGRITCITDWKKTDELHSGRPMPNSFAIANEQQATVRLRELLQISGSPENVELRNLRLTDEQGRKYAVASAGAFVRFRSRRLVGPYCSVSIDRFDGKLISLDQLWDYHIETEEPVLQANAARTRAEQLYFANRVESDRYPMNPEVPELIYIRRQGGYGSVATPLEEPIAQLRIVFSVKFGPDQVFIDAVTGQTMGGVVSKERPH